MMATRSSSQRRLLTNVAKSMARPLGPPGDDAEEDADDVRPRDIK